MGKRNSILIGIFILIILGIFGEGFFLLTKSRDQNINFDETSLTKLEFPSQIAGKSIKLNTDSVKTYLNNIGFSSNSKISIWGTYDVKDVEKIKIDFTDEEQPFDKTYNSKQVLIHSFGQRIDSNNSELHLLIYLSPTLYNDPQFELILNDRISRYLFLQLHGDFFMDKSLEQKMRQIEDDINLKKYPLIKLTNKQSYNFFLPNLLNLFVPSVYAQSCGGYYDCGNYSTIYECSDPGGSCNIGTGDCGTFDPDTNSYSGTCSSRNVCNGGGQKSCSYKNESQCGQSSAGQCAAGECITNYGCSWDSGGGGGGGCNASCSGKSCGDDGCGGSCGSCSGSQICNSGSCEDPAPGQVCSSGQWDSCGSHSCGGCQSAQCNGSGTGWSCVDNQSLCCPGPGGSTSTPTPLPTATPTNTPVPPTPTPTCIPIGATSDSSCTNCCGGACHAGFGGFACGGEVCPSDGTHFCTSSFGCQSNGYLIDNSYTCYGTPGDVCCLPPPSFTPVPPTLTPTPTINPCSLSGRTCGQCCEGSNQCVSGLTCYSNICHNSACYATDNSSCSCPSGPTSTPTRTPTPGGATSTPTRTPTPTPTGICNATGLACGAACCGASQCNSGVCGGIGQCVCSAPTPTGTSNACENRACGMPQATCDSNSGIWTPADAVCVNNNYSCCLPPDPGGGGAGVPPPSPSSAISLCTNPATPQCGSNIIMIPCSFPLVLGGACPIPGNPFPIYQQCLCPTYPPPPPPGACFMGTSDNTIVPGQTVTLTYNGVNDCSCVSIDPDDGTAAISCGGYLDGVSHTYNLAPQGASSTDDATYTVLGTGSSCSCTTTVSLSCPTHSQSLPLGSNITCTDSTADANYRFTTTGINSDYTIEKGSVAQFNKIVSGANCNWEFNDGTTASGNQKAKNLNQGGKWIVKCVNPSDPNSYCQRSIGAFCLDDVPTTTLTLTPTLTNTPTPAEWYKLKNSSFHKNGALTDTIPLLPTPYDAEDNTEAKLVIENAGVVSSGGSIELGNGTVSPDGWMIENYSKQNTLSASSFIEYIQSRKEHIKVEDLGDLSSRKINVLTSGDITLNAGNANQILSNAPLVVIVQGNLTIENDFNVPASIGQSPKSVALMVTGTLNIKQSVKEIGGIFIATAVDFASDTGTETTNPLKIKGNLIISSTSNSISKRKRANLAQPSVFIVFDPTLYLDLLPSLSTQTYERQRLQ